jgi:hypothetical protein
MAKILGWHHALIPIHYICNHVGWTCNTEVEGVKTFRQSRARMWEIRSIRNRFRYPVDEGYKRIPPTSV